MERVDETIEDICEWIKAELKKTDCTNQNSILPEMTRALAELVSARDKSVKYEL